MDQPLFKTNQTIGCTIGFSEEIAFSQDLSYIEEYFSASVTGARFINGLTTYLVVSQIFKILLISSYSIKSCHVISLWNRLEKTIPKRYHMTGLARENMN